MHAAPRSVQQQPQKEQEKQHDHAGAITVSQALDSNSSSTLSAARAPAERQQQQQHAPQGHSSDQNGRPKESNPHHQPQPGSHRDGTAPAISPELIRSRRDGQQDRAMQDSFRFKYTDQQPAQQPAAAGSSTGASQVGGVATQQQQHVVIGSAVAYEQPHAPNPYAVSMDNGHLACHMAVAASQAQPLVQSQPQLQQQQQQQVTFSLGTQPAYSSSSIAQVMPPQPARPPATFSLPELCHSREFIMNRARTLGEQGGKRLELMMMPYLLQRLDADRLPTNDVTLLHFAPDMMPVAGTRPKDFLMIWTMWVKWAKTASIPSVPLVAPLITFFLLDSVPTLEDRARLVQILDSYRHSVNEVLSSLGGQHPNVVLPDWTQDRWTEWTEMLQTGKTSLFDWKAVREVCGLGVPPAAAEGLVAPALSSSAPASMISGSSFRPAIAAAPSAQQQPQHSPEQQRQQQSTQQPQQQSNRNTSGTAPTMSRRSIGSSAETFNEAATRSDGPRAPTNSLDLAATNAQTRAAEAARLTAAEVQASLTSTYFPHARHLPPPAQTSADTTSAHSMSIDDAATFPHVAAAAGNAVQNGPAGPDSAATVLGKRKRPSVTATVENWKRLAEEAPQALPPQATPSVSIAAPASSQSTAAAAPQQHSASTASNFGNVQAQAQSSTLPTPIQQTLSSLQPFAAGAQAAPPPSAPPPPQAQALPAQAVNVQHRVPPPPPRTQFGASQQHQQQSDANMPPKKRARGRPKKATEQQQQLVTMDATDEEFEKAVAAARGAIQAFEIARSAYVEGWRANPATSGAPLPPIARSRVRAAVDVVSASPWRDGKKQVFGSTANPPLAIDEPYGDYVPNTKPRALPAPARTQASTQLSDPLFITRPFPNLPANGGLPPVELHSTRKPCPATGRTMDLFAITPHPFYPYPAALKRLDKAEVDKALEHINKLADSSAQRVDLDQAASMTASGDKPDDRQRAQAIKTVLARHVRRAVQGSRPLKLSEDLGSQKVPKLAKRTWKLVKKVYPGPTAAASTSSAAATASEGAATTAAAQSAQPPIKAASLPPKQVSSTSAAQSSRDGVAPLPPQSSKKSSSGQVAISSPVTVPGSRPDTPLSVPAPLAAGLASTSSQVPIDAGGLSKPARPSLAAIGSPASAPIVPGVRPRAKSIQGMRRVSSGPGVHPLAQLYATAPNTIRQQLREMSVAVPGVPSDPVAEALAAAAKKIQPRRRSMSMTASPRLPSSHKELAHPSPPLVPIPLADVGASEETSVAKDTDKGKARRLSVDPPHPQSGTSALGVTLDADTVADSSSANPADAMQIDAAEGADGDEAADASVEVADSQPDEEDHHQQPDADRASSASSSMFASAVSSVARAAGGALASAARAFMHGSGGGVSSAPSPPVPGSPAADNPANAAGSKPTSAKDGAGVPRGGQSDKNAAATAPASKSTTAPASAGGKPRPKASALDGTRVRLPPLHMSTEPLHPCALRDLAVKKRWMQASEPFRPFGP